MPREQQFGGVLMVQRTYYPPAETVEELCWEPPVDDVHTLKHGYNLADVDVLARRAVWRVWGLHLDYRTRFDLAWSGVVEALYAAEERPDPADLVFAGQDQIVRQVHADMHLYGVDRHARPGEQMRGFEAYWQLTARVSPSPETKVVERAALWQIWPTLTDMQRKSLLALAAHGTYQAAARSLGIAEKTLKHHLQAGRQRFLELWHQHEQPSRFWGSGRRVYRAGDEAPVEESYRKAAKAIQHRKRTPRPVRPALEIKHGTLGAYNRHKCRCVKCVAAKSAESTERRRKAGNAVRRFMTVSQFAEAVRRNEAGETWTQIAASMGFSDSYLRSLRSGRAQPVPDLIAEAA